jgi:gliding motility-associated-like protein
MDLTRKILCALFVFCLGWTLAQRSKNGDYIVSGTQVLNAYTKVTSSVTVGQQTIYVSSNQLTSTYLTTPLSAGDLIMIIQMQGAQMDIDVTPAASWGGTYTIPNGYLYSGGWFQVPYKWGQVTDYKQAGKFELVEVLDVSGTNEILLNCPLTNSYARSGHVQVVRIPRLNNLTVGVSDSIVPLAWDGDKGGIVALEVNGDLVLEMGAVISASNKGFRGGVADNQGLSNTAISNEGPGLGNSQLGSTDQREGGRKGEGIGGFTYEYDSLYSRYGRGAPANGGGGGGYQNCGGGGGSNFGSGVYSGNGTPSATYSSACWNLEKPGFAATTCSGGGRGGYSYSNVNLNATTTGPNNTSWGGDARKVNGGLGGHALDFDATRIFFGGGGGAGDQDSQQAGSGGSGGGLVYVDVYGVVSGNGKFEANGQDGFNSNPTNAVPGVGVKLGNDGAGGGGAGGHVYIRNMNPLPSTITLSVQGGKGGNHALSIGQGGGSQEASGPGGGGSAGIVTYVSGSPAQVIIPGKNGTTNSLHLTEFPANGATDGGLGFWGLTTTIFNVITTDTTICGANSVVLNYSIVGSNPGTLGWYTAPVGGTLLHTGNSFVTPMLNATTTYYVGTCSGHFRQPVTVFVGGTPLISGTPSITDATCGNYGSLSGLSVSGGTAPYNYIWNGNVMSSIDLDSLQEGNYVLEVVDAYGCRDTSSSYSVLGFVGPKLDSSAIQITDQLCDKNLGSITGIVFSNAVSTIDISWNNNSTLNTLDIHNLTAGSYVLRIKDVFNCSDSMTVMIQYIAGPQLDSSNLNTVDIPCMGYGSIQGMTTQGGSLPLSYAWNGVTGNIDALNLVAGNYTLIVQDANGCADTSSIYSIASTPKPVIDSSLMIKTNANCNGTLGKIEGVSVFGGAQPLSTIWNANPLTNTLDQNNLQAGIYQLIVTDAVGCSDTMKTTISFLEGPKIDSSAVVFIQPSCIQLGSISGLSVVAGGASYSWTGTSQTTLDLGGLQGGVSYTLTVTDSNNCKAYYGPVFMNPLTYPNAAFTGPNSAHSNETISYINQSQSIIPIVDNYWIVEGQQIQSTNLIYAFSQTGTYPVILFITDANGCSDSIQYMLSVIDDIIVPNIFTPNQDGMNEYFEIKNLSSETALVVLDRWGNVVFESTDYQNNWTGKSMDGSELADGVYFYRVKPVQGDTIDGFLHLVR